MEKEAMGTAMITRPAEAMIIPFGR